MTTSHPHPYPAYKLSGVPWLGDLPEHWEVRRLKQVCSRYSLYGANIAASNYKGGGIRFLRTTDITDDGDLLDGGVFLPKDLVEDYLLADGDILLSRSGTVGRSFLYSSTMNGQCAYAGYLVRYVPNLDVLPKYLFLFTKTSHFHGFLRLMAISSTIENVNAEKYANCHLPLPPLLEQRAIVRYLDYVDGRIRRYVAAKEKLVGLLEEERQAVVNRAVTRGLDPNVRLKPSGVDWLGDVPEHWEVRRLRTVVEMRVSNVDKHTKEDELAVRLCNYVDVYKNEQITQSMDFMKATARQDEIDRFRLKRGDVLITKDSESWDDIGVPSVVTESSDDLISGYHLALLRPAKEMLGGYLGRVLQGKSSAHQFHVRANGVTRYGLTHSGIKSVFVPLPPFSEQRAIVEYLGKTTANIDEAIARARRQIELLQEYRTRLIADVVTGKLDVRAAAVGLPDEADKQSPVDELEASMATSVDPLDRQAADSVSCEAQ